MQFDYVVVGAGVAGCTIARLLKDVGKKVIIVEKRNSIGGLAFDGFRDGLYYQRFGVHAIHTNNPKVVKFLSKFSRLKAFSLKSVSYANGQIVPVPINKKTLEILGCSEKEAIELLYHKYSEKLWGKDYDRDTLKRVTPRESYDDRHHLDKYQLFPIAGFNAMFASMIADIPTILSYNFKTDTTSWDLGIKYKSIIWTGRIDEFFNFHHGELPYLRLVWNFNNLIISGDIFSKHSIINFPTDYDYHRLYNWQYLITPNPTLTCMTAETVDPNGEVCYPKLTKESKKLAQVYKNMCPANTYFLGRFAQYEYLNMDKVIENAFELFEKLKKESV